MTIAYAPEIELCLADGKAKPPSSPVTPIKPKLVIETVGFYNINQGDNHPNDAYVYKRKW